MFKGPSGDLPNVQIDEYKEYSLIRLDGEHGESDDEKPGISLKVTENRLLLRKLKKIDPIKYCINSYAVISYLAVLFTAFFFGKAT